MSNRKALDAFIFLAVIAGVVMLIFFIWTNMFPTDSMAMKNWEKICKKIDDGKVVSAKVSGSDSNGNNLVNAEINIKDCLSKEDFNRYLPKEVGPPTSEYGIITVKFNDRSEVVFGNWKTGTFSGDFKGRYYEFGNGELFNRLQLLYLEQVEKDES